MKKMINSAPIRISVVDNHPIFFLGIQMALKKTKGHTIELINHYINGNEMIIELSNINSDVILIDMCLPDISGDELAHLILEKYPDMKIGIYSNMLDHRFILNAIKSGVLGYLPKTANASEIVEFIQTISRGERYVRGIVAEIIFENDRFLNKQHEFNITKRELEILQLIINGSKNREIAKNLSIALRTVEFHKQNLYVKLDVNNSIELYKEAIRLDILPTKEGVK